MMLHMAPVSIPGVVIRPPKSAPGAGKRKKPAPNNKPAKRKPTGNKSVKKKTVKKTTVKKQPKA